MELLWFGLPWQLLDPNQSYSCVSMKSTETLEVTPLHSRRSTGLASVVPSVGWIIELTPERHAVLAQTSVKLFQFAGVQPQ
jgi:hypothetical protein